MSADTSSSRTCLYSVMWCCLHQTHLGLGSLWSQCDSQRHCLITEVISKMYSGALLLRQSSCFVKLVLSANAVVARDALYVDDRPAAPSAREAHAYNAALLRLANVAPEAAQALLCITDSCMMDKV
jgi:hypothetical protein